MINEIIERIYLHPKVRELIKNIKPEHLQQDLLQEVALVLLTYPPDKIIKLHKEGNLLAYTLKTIWKLGTGTKGSFYKIYKKNDLIKAIDYFRSQLGKEIPISTSNIASNILLKKLDSNANDAHESIIFQKYVELKNAKKVAEFFNIPHLHAFNVIKKTKNELKRAINEQNT